ncbi:MAG: hypothetical protein BAJATHORv1_20042 [Candidatus Thorarchaeota archaeon]|nr:MAG: hypothetical protein BAJATHORv1_20042 [Candidatus Thorarchaeota archaeon]
MSDDDSGDTFEISYHDLLVEIYSGRIELIREMERVFGKDAVHKAVSNFYERQSVSSSAKMMEREGTISSMSDFRDLLLKIDSRPFMTKTMITEHPESEDDAVLRIVKKCMWADIFRDLGAADLGDIMLCKTDFATAKVIHPKIQLERSKTLMSGDECCDFVYSWKE